MIVAGATVFVVAQRKKPTSFSFVALATLELLRIGEITRVVMDILHIYHRYTNPFLFSFVGLDI